MAWSVQYGTLPGPADNPRQPSVAALVLAGLAATVTPGTVTGRIPSAAAVALSGGASTLLRSAIIQPAPASVVFRGPVGYSTAFPLTENPISEGGKWTSGSVSPPRTDVQTDGVHAFGTMFNFDGTNFNDSVGIINLPTIQPNQWAMGTIYNQGAVSGQECELVLRGIMNSSTNTGLEIDCVLATGHIDLVAWLGPANTFSTLASISGQTFNHNDVIYAQIVGTVVTVMKGTSVATLSTVLTHDTAADSLPFSTGTPGQGHWNQTGVQANCTKLGWSKWSCGEI